MSLSTMVTIVDAVAAEGLVGEAEVKETIAGLTAFTDDAESIVACPECFRCGGHKRSIGHLAGFGGG
jgi:hypothetical protein